MSTVSVLLMSAVAACSGSGVDKYCVESITVLGTEVYYYVKGLEQPFEVLFLADTHFTVEDERGKDYYQYSSRMGGWAVEPENYGHSNGRDEALAASLARAREAGARMVILGGDIINFPSLASVEHLKAITDTASVECVYVAGNHDWHYEGEPGIDFTQRDKWVTSNLKPLYADTDNPMCFSRTVGGVNFVMIDNSLFEITEEQLEFFTGEIAKGMPVILSMHIPLYLPGHNIDYGCGSPEWNHRNDIYFEIERREPWPESGCSPTTLKFRELALTAPEVIGIYAGHTHEKAVDFVNNRIQYVVGANYSHDDVMMHFVPVK